MRAIDAASSFVVSALPIPTRPQVARTKPDSTPSSVSFSGTVGADDGVKSKSFTHAEAQSVERQRKPRKRLDYVERANERLLTRWHSDLT